jgi:hypothetical protein
MAMSGWLFVLTVSSPQEKEDHRDDLWAIAVEGQGGVRLVMREDGCVIGDVHDGHAGCASGAGASRFLIGLLTRPT